MSKVIDATLEKTELGVVVQGLVSTRQNSEDAFCAPKQLGLFQYIESDYPKFTSKDVVHRVPENYAAYVTRNKANEASSTDISTDARQVKGQFYNMPIESGYGG